MHKWALSFLGYVLLVPVSVWADGVWVEVGDAGNNVPGAQIVYGSGALTQITGFLGAPGDSSSLVDVFKIFVTDPINFTATTSGGIPDPELFLFDSLGHGLEGNRDISSSNSQAYLTGGESPPLLVYLWISEQDREPGYNASGVWTPMFPSTGGVGEMIGSVDRSAVLSGPGTSGPGTQVNSANSSGKPPYPYTITLTGASYVPTPEPASVLLFGLGVAACLWRVRHLVSTSRR